MSSPLTTRARNLTAKLGFERDWYLFLLAAGIGTLTAGVAMLFIWLIHAAVHLFESASGAAQLWMIGLLPTAGALVTGIIVYLVASEARGHGVPEVLYAIHRRQSRISIRVAIAKWTSAIFTIGTGGSAGAEGPIVQIGSALGSSLGRLIRTPPGGTATLLGCGAAAGIASVFNAPIAGIFFVLEILLRDFSVRTFTPIVIAAVFSAACTQAVHGANEALFQLPEGFNVGAFTPHEIPNYMVLGIVAGLGAIGFIKALYGTEGLYERVRLHAIVKPMTGALLLGGLGLCYVLLFRPSDRLPPFFSNGYPVITRMLSFEYYEGRETMILLTGLVAIGLFKGLATCLTIGSGGSGGIFAPSLLMGACVGGAFGSVVNALDWAPHASPAHYALVGMAAFVAATTHAPMTAILIVYEVTRSYQIILPLMLSAVVSTIVARLIMSDSIYTLKLTRRGLRFGAMSDLTVLRRLDVNDVPLIAPVFVHPDDSAQRLLELSEKMSVNDFVVTDRRDRYLGMVTGADLKEALVYREAIPLLQVHELQRIDLPTVTLDETLDEVMNKFATHDVASLVVVGDSGPGSVLGLITRSRLMRRYQDELNRV